MNAVKILNRVHFSATKYIYSCVLILERKFVFSTSSILCMRLYCRFGSSSSSYACTLLVKLNGTEVRRSKRTKSEKYMFTYKKSMYKTRRTH